MCLPLQWERGRQVFPASREPRVLKCPGWQCKYLTRFFQILISHSTDISTCLIQIRSDFFDVFHFYRHTVFKKFLRFLRCLCDRFIIKSALIFEKNFYCFF